ncbi:MAG: HlyC/CorC family transporter [Chlamydiales bacterium]|nr:HlyC/CorC family transporter [Chlamydiales bacterium]
MMPMMLLFLAALVLLSGFFASSLIALFSLTTSEVRLEKCPRIPRLLARPRDLLVTLLFCDICANILIQNTTASLFGPLSSWVIKVAVPLGIILIFGEILPKTIAIAFNAKIARMVAPVVEWIQRLLGPVRRFITFITTHISNTLFFFLKKDQPLSSKEIQYVLQTSEKSGLLNHDEAQLVQGFLSLSTHTIKEKMHPRSEIIAFNLDDPIEKLVELFVEKKCARILVYKGDLQNLLGICVARELFLDGSDLTAILQKPFYVPESLSARTLLRQFHQTGEVFAVVVDEYGSISGVITKEDLMEIVVGDIADPRDAKPLYTQSSKDTVISSGRWELSHFAKVFETELPSKNNMATVGGWLTEQLGGIPKTGTHYQWKNFLFHVLSASPNRVRTLYIKRVKHE